MAKPKVGGYNWRYHCNRSITLHDQMQIEVRELGRNPNSLHRRLVELSTMIAESRAAMMEMATIAENEKEKGK